MGLNITRHDGQWGFEIYDTTVDHEPLVVLFKETEYKYEKVNMLKNVFIVEFRYRRKNTINDILKSSLRKTIENCFARKFEDMYTFCLFYVLNFEGIKGEGFAKVRLIDKNNNILERVCKYGSSEFLPSFMQFAAMDQETARDLFFAFLQSEITEVQISPIEEASFIPLSFNINSEPAELNRLAHRAAEKIGYKIGFTKDETYIDMDFLSDDWWKEATLEQVERKIKHGVDVNAFDGGWTVLMHAVWNNSNPTIINTLIKHGAYVNTMTPYGGATALTIAVISASRFFQNPDIVETLIKHGADINAKERNEKGRTALMESTIHNRNSAITEMLIKYGADINAIDRNGKSALIWATQLNENPEVIEILLKYRADYKVKDNDGKTALDYAEENPKIYKTNVYWSLRKLTYK